MPPALADRSVAARRVRIRGAGGDALRLRLGIDRLLRGADVRPRGLPPAAVLLVRSLDDPLPGRLDPRAMTPPLEWQRQVSGALARHAARAARPAAGSVAANAEAVVFSDRAELLACLARDWCGGSLSSRWWWAAMGLHSPPAVLRAFGDEPEAVPAAIERLVLMRAAAAFAARIEPATAAALLRTVAAAFGALPAAEAALTAPRAEALRLDDGAPEPMGPDVPAPETSTLPPPIDAPAAVGDAPWTPFVHAAAVELALLAPEQEALIGLGAALRRASPLVRSPAFVAATRTWRARRHAERSRPRPPRSAAASRLETAASPEARTSARRPRPVTPARHAPAGAEATAEAGAPVRTDVRRLAPERPLHALTAAEGVREPSVEPGFEIPVAAAVETRLGGLFHLVLVAQHLGLYGDFSTPAQPGIALDVWDFVTLVGRRLVVRPPRDPVWNLLAELAGRSPREPPGRGYRPPRSWRIPRPWLEPFDDDSTWRFAERDGRLLLIHPQGFAVVDAAGAELDRELKRYRVRHARATTRRSTGRADLERWVDHLATYLRARLALALGVAARDAARVALVRPAHVFVSDTRVEIVSSLADLPIEVRRAGLDRDAGYVPAAGRTLAFHFE